MIEDSNTKSSRENNRFIGKTLKPRNPLHDADIMKKGGAHTQPKRDKTNTKRYIQDALDEEF